MIVLLMTIDRVSAKNVVQGNLTTGKYTEMPKKAKYKKKSWLAKADESQLSIYVDFIKKDIKKKDDDFSTDEFQLKIKKLMVNGLNVAEKFKEDIEIFVSPNQKSDFKGHYKDPVTGNTLVITLKFVEDEQLDFMASVSSDPRNDKSKGTIFPSRTISLAGKSNQFL